MQSKTFRLEEPELSDSALQAQILQRCRRSLDHDIKNAVQALHSGIEVLSRALHSQGNRRISPLECIPLLQQQLANLQTKLAALFDEVMPETGSPAAFDLVELLTGLLRFLSHERAVTQAQLQLPSQATVIARKSVVRRVLLSCILDALDSMESQGSLQFGITQADSRVTLELRVIEAAPSSSEVSPQRRRLWQILERTLANEGLPISFVATQEGYTAKMLLPADVTAANETPAPASQPATPEVQASASAKTLRILVVDDNRDAADSLALLLELEGHDTRSVYTGAQALALMGEYQPALVLLDIGLPDLPGDVVAQRIRASSSRQPLLVSISGYDRGAKQRATMPVAFDAELVKPIELPDLQQLLTTLLR